MTETLMQEPEELLAAPAAGPRRPSFLFAKRHGLLVTGEEDGKVLVLHTPAIEPAAVVELRRFMGRPLKLRAVEPEQLDY